VRLLAGIAIGVPVGAVLLWLVQCWAERIAFRSWWGP